MTGVEEKDDHDGDAKTRGGKFWQGSATEKKMLDQVGTGFLVVACRETFSHGRLSTPPFF